MPLTFGLTFLRNALGLGKHPSVGLLFYQTKLLDWSGKNQKHNAANNTVTYFC